MKELNLNDIVTEDVLEQVAKIIGPHSAADQALRDLKVRRARGEDPVCFKHGSSFIVVDKNKLEEQC